MPPDPVNGLLTIFPPPNFLKSLRVGRATVQGNDDDESEQACPWNLGLVLWRRLGFFQPDRLIVVETPAQGRGFLFAVAAFVGSPGVVRNFCDRLVPERGAGRATDSAG